MIILFSGLTLLYCICILWLYWHWLKIPSFQPEPVSSHELPYITIVVPVRNEADNIIALLQGIAKQRVYGGSPYPFSKLEVIIVDDDSEDDTKKLVMAYRKEANFSIDVISLRLPPGFTGSHKKMAITQAIALARGEIVVTTDGDCRVGSYWLASLSQFFQERKPLLVSGPVSFDEEKNLFEHFQTIEFASLIGTGAASMQAGRPNMCNGANLAFRKDTFFAVNGYEGSVHVPSGDDEFLMQKIYQKYPQQVFFLKTPLAVVYTNAKASVKEFYHQRRRWAGKWKLHKNKSVMAIAVFVFIYHLASLFTLLLIIVKGYFWFLFLLLWLLKAAIEFFFLRDVLLFMGKKMPFQNFLMLEFIYSAYVVFFGICANFGGYTWKDRQYK